MLRFLAVLCCGLFLACSAEINGPGDPRFADLECTARATGFQPLRRLSAQQIENSLRDLFGGQLGRDLVAMVSIPEAEVTSGFSTEADANVVNTGASNAFEDAAGVIAEHLLANASSTIPAVMPCAGSSSDADIDGCIDGFIASFGSRAYRRPLETDETALLRGVYDAVRAGQGAAAGWSSVVEVIIQAPQFLYLVERGVDPDATGLRPLTGYEMASRLSYFLTNTLPDAQLVAAAAAGDLQSVEQLEAHARRLLDTPGAIDVMADFHREWLGLYDFDDIAKDPMSFPEFDENVRAALRDEIRVITEHTIRNTDGSIGSLLTTDTYPVSDALASIYGVPASAPASDGVGVRRGLLTSSAFMSIYADYQESSPVVRGVHIRTAVLCGETGTPVVTADEIDQTLGSAANAPTARERLAPLVENSSCAGCHSTFNPLGLAFENFDALGRWRDQENGATIDATGEVVNAGDANGFFSDPGDFVTQIAYSSTAQSCYAEKLFRYAVGRLNVEADSCSLEYLDSVVGDTNGNIRDLFVAMATTDAFRYRVAE